MSQKKTEKKKKVPKKTETKKPEIKKIETNVSGSALERESILNRKVRDGERSEAKANRDKGLQRGGDIWSVIVHPSLSEKSIVNIERQNKLVFVVSRKANKQQVKNAVESAFAVKVTKVNIAITPSGVKKAYVKLAPENLALDVATKLGMM